MARLLRPVMKIMSVIPAAAASSTAYWISGLSTTGSISFGLALVTGRKRVPSPATGNTAFVILRMGSPFPWITTKLLVQPWRCAPSLREGLESRLHAGQRRHGRHEDALRLATARPARPLPSDLRHV